MDLHPTSEPPFAPSASGSSHPPRERSAVTPWPAANGYSKDVNTLKSTPWYRTSKGIVFIAAVAFAIVVVIVCITAIVATQNKNNNNQSPEPTVA